MLLTRAELIDVVIRVDGHRALPAVLEQETPRLDLESVGKYSSTSNDLPVAGRVSPRPGPSNRADLVAITEVGAISLAVVLGISAFAWLRIRR